MSFAIPPSPPPSAPVPGPDAVSRPVTAADLPPILDLHARVFGPGRFARSAYRVRQGTAEISRHCRLVEIGPRLVAAIRMTDVTIGGMAGALLLGPLAVEPAYAGLGHGKRLVGEVVEAARREGCALIVLVGDASYYSRFGFEQVCPGRIWLPGPADPARILAAELSPGALERFSGVVAAAPTAFDAPFAT